MAGVLDDYDIQTESIRRGLLSDEPTAMERYGLLSEQGGDAPVYRRGTPGQAWRARNGADDVEYAPGSPVMDAIGQWARDHPLDAGALALSPVPFVGGGASFANDMRHYATDPESRTLLNYGLTGLGAALPFGGAIAGAIRGAGKGLGKYTHGAILGVDDMADYMPFVQRAVDSGAKIDDLPKVKFNLGDLPPGLMQKIEPQVPAWAWRDFQRVPPRADPDTTLAWHIATQHPAEAERLWQGLPKYLHEPSFVASNYQLDRISRPLLATPLPRKGYSDLVVLEADLGKNAIIIPTAFERETRLLSREPLRNREMPREWWEQQALNQKSRR